jgi:hypothetical protein
MENNHDNQEENYTNQGHQLFIVIYGFILFLTIMLGGYSIDSWLGDRIILNETLMITGKIIDITKCIHIPNENKPFIYTGIGEYHQNDNTIHYYYITDESGKKYFVEPILWDRLKLYTQYSCAIRRRRFLPDLEMGYTPFIVDTEPLPSSRRRRV